MKVFKTSMLVFFLFQYSQVRSQATPPGTVIFSEDFNGSLPTTWSVVNNNPNNFQWIWETQYRPGQYSTCSDKIASTTTGNGFMLLPMDFYNTPSLMPVTMDTYIETPAITIPSNAPFVLFRFQQFMR